MASSQKIVWPYPADGIDWQRNSFTQVSEANPADTFGIRMSRRRIDGA